MNEIEKPVFIVRTTVDGGISLKPLRDEIPNLVILVDCEHDAMANFLRAMNYTEKPCVHLEDDIILCDNFYEKINEIIRNNPNDVIQFFSMRKDDLTIGTRWINGSKYLMNQCFYLPKGMGKEVAVFRKEHYVDYGIGGTDCLLRDYLAFNRIKYLNIVPNLVDHMVTKSRIDPRRSSKRQSFTFKK